MKSFTSKLAPIIKEYLEFRKTLGYSDRQDNHLAMFDAYCHEYHPDLETLTKESVRGWVSHEISQGRGGMYNIIGSVRMLALYMGNGAYILPTAAVTKKPKSMPYILTDDELSRLFSAIDNVKYRIHFKKSSSPKAMFSTLFRLMYSCGLRPTETRLIKHHNINFDTGEIFIEKSKGHKDRIVVMSDDMLEQCRRYDVIRAIANPKSEYFFVRADDVPVPTRQFHYFFERCWQQANPDVPENMLPRVRPYDLRHRFASAVLQKWLNEGRDLYAMLPYLQAYMGHEQFSDTAYYIHLLPENLLNSSGIDWSAIDAVDPEVGVWIN